MEDEDAAGAGGCGFQRAGPRDLRGTSLGLDLPNQLSDLRGDDAQLLQSSLVLTDAGDHGGRLGLALGKLGSKRPRCLAHLLEERPVALGFLLHALAYRLHDRTRRFGR